MRVWIAGPRIFGNRTGFSFGPEDLRRLKRAGAPERRPSAFVYVIRKTLSGHIKVGIGADPRERLRALQTGSSEPLDLVYACAVKSNDGNAIEFAAHDLMWKHRLVGEWFDTTPEMAVAAIAAAAHKLGDAIVEIPKERIGDVLEIAARQDSAKPKRSFFLTLLRIILAALAGIVIACGIQIIILMTRL